MRFLVLSLSFLTGLTLLAADADTGIRDAEHAWAKAVVSRDFQALDHIYGDKLIYAHSTGAIQSKPEYLERLRSGAQRYDSIEHESIRVVMYGGSAVSHSIVRMTGVSEGKPFNDHVMMLHVWEKEGGGWHLVAHQTTKLPQ